MKLAVFSHKEVWKSDSSATGYATDGGFAFQMAAISALFNETLIVVPVLDVPKKEGEVPIHGRNVKIYPIKNIKGSNLSRKLRYPIWLIRHIFTFAKIIRQYDAIHVPIPSDIGTLGMVIAKILKKPLFVRHCGNWLSPKTMMDKFWKWFMETYAGGRNVMLATGGTSGVPSKKNSNIKWIFSTSLSADEISQLNHPRPIPDKNRLRLIIICRQQKEKGTEKVIRAIPDIIKFFGKVDLDVVGDGPYLETLKKITSDISVDNFVHFHGKVNHDKVITLLRAADIFVYPTTASEGFPKVVLEAMACGLPVITNPVSVLPFLLSNGGGIVLENDDAKSITAAIHTVFSGEEYSKYSRAAQKTSAAFTLEAWGNFIRTQLIEAWPEYA